MLWLLWKLEKPTVVTTPVCGEASCSPVRVKLPAFLSVVKAAVVLSVSILAQLTAPQGPLGNPHRQLVCPLQVGLLLGVVGSHAAPQN
jgi:hypothetical protein